MICKLEDITDEQQTYADAYLRKVIVNTKNKSYHRQMKPRQYGITFVPLDPDDNNLVYEDPGFEKAMCQHIRVLEQDIPVYNTSLYWALLCLTDKQRVALLGNVVLRIPMGQIAHILGVYPRTAEKYKHNAIQRVRRYMDENTEP